MEVPPTLFLSLISPMHYVQCAGAQAPASIAGPGSRGLGRVLGGLMQRWVEQTAALGVAQVRLGEQPRRCPVGEVGQGIKTHYLWHEQGWHRTCLRH